MSRLHPIPLSILLVAALSCGRAPRSLVPDTPSAAPDYLCTWNLQGYLTSYTGSENTRSVMTEKSLFGDAPGEGWARLYPSIRKDLYFVMDDSWDIPLDRNEKRDNPYYGTDQLDPGRFPSFKGNPTERLRALSDSLLSLGWKGLGGWICAQKADIYEDTPEDEFFKARLLESEQAGVRYWKLDWGRDSRKDGWREHLTALGRTYAPSLIIENAMKGEYIRFSDTFRTYDVENIIAQTVTIARVAELLPFSHDTSAMGLINCEDEAYVAAGLGCAIGVMRHPFVGALPSGEPDHVFPEACRDLKRRTDEIVRAVRWHRISLPFGVGGEYHVDGEILHDGWLYAHDESWVRHEEGDIVPAEAPARVSRGMALPKVGSTDPERPFTLASTYPDGNVAVATIGRSLGRKYVLKSVPVEINVGSKDAKVGVFGEYETLTLVYPSALGRVKVLAQDLAGDTPVDITSRVRVEGERIVLPGDVLHEIGLMAATPGDLSDPGLVLCLR